MKDWLKKWLGLEELEVKNAALEMKLRQVNKRLGRLDSKPLRYAEVERARKLAKKEFIRTGTCV